MKKTALYFLALIPPIEIETEINGLKEYIWTQYGSKASLRSPPHITLHMPFKYNEVKEEKLIQRLEVFAKSHAPIPVKLHNFGAFAPRVIYVNVLPDDALENLHNELLKWAMQELKIFSKDNPYRAFRPHMTIAFRDLQKEKFSAAWLEFENRKIEFEFNAGSLYLLKHDGKMWQKYSELKFNSPNE